ncbi:MAG: hypothetical protein RLZZ234_762 [Candidatus Parcubacteria bacterium]|jgi:hypothetical protein
MYSLRKSLYHRILRTSLVIVALLLAFTSGVLISDTQQFAASGERYLANAVGMYAAVSSNEINTLNAALTNRAHELDAREREIDARAQGAAFITDPRTVYALSLILLVQLVLIVTNYALDFRRARVQKVSA